MKNSEKILYTKYSNDRAKEFRILTQIIDDGTKRFIRKKAWDESAKEHIKKLILHEKTLSAMFQGTNFVVNRIIAHGEDFVDFEYIEGTGFDKILDEFLKENDEEGFKKFVSVFFAELDKIATAEFHQNEKTIELLGENAFEEGEKAIPAGNIDLIFQNIIVDSKGRWNVIDYEWTFNFALPLKLLKCRVLLLYFFTSSARFHIYSPDFLNYFDLTETDFDVTKRIDHKNFTHFVQKNHADISILSQSLRKRIFNPYMLEQISDCIEVFYDTGNGFSEAEKDIFYQFPVSLQPRENFRALRIDPACKHCFVSGVSIKSGEKELDFTTNAFNCTNGVFFFNTSDPQIYVNIAENITMPITINMQVSTFGADIAANIEERYTSIEERYTSIEELQANLAEYYSVLGEQYSIVEKIRSVAADFRLHLQKQIQQADEVIQSKQHEINSIYASRSWKITKPLRQVGQIARKIIKK